MLTQLAALSAIALGTCAVPQGDLTDPHTWGNYFLDKYAHEREAAMTLEPGPGPIAHPRTVLLITGVTIPAKWFDPIKARLERDGFRTVVYEPPELLSGDLFVNSEALQGVVEHVLAQTGEQKIDILAECTGGLIARHYIQALGGNEHVSRLVTFISPQHGLPKAAEAALVAHWPALDDLTPGSTFLDTVNSAPLPADVAVTSIYSCTDEYIQPYETSKIPGAKNIEVCDGFVGHFQFFYDPKLYLLMHDALVAPSPGDPQPQDPQDGQPQDPSDPSDPGSSMDDGGGCSSSGGDLANGTVLALGLALAARRRRSR